MTPACASTVALVAGHLGRALYANDLEGSNAHYSRRRVEGSRALGDAVRAGDGARATSVLRSLLRMEISRIRVLRRGVTVAEVGHAASLAPLRGAVRDSRGAVVGHYVMSLQTDRSFQSLTEGAGAANVVIRQGHTQEAGLIRPATIPRRGPVTVHGTRYSAYTFTRKSFDGPPVHISYLVPLGSGAVARMCAPSRPRIALNVVAATAHGIYKGEVDSPSVRRARAIIAQAPDMVAAVARADPLGIHRAIVRLFKTTLHVVRVRVTDPAGGLLEDLGGPAVLAPVHGVFTGPSGAVIGHFVFSLQDDTGYDKLVGELTGAGVALRSGGRQVSGTVTVGRHPLPEDGPVRLGKVTYLCHSFVAQAFPAAPLRISILIRPERYLADAGP